MRPSCRCSSRSPRTPPSSESSSRSARARSPRPTTPAACSSRVCEPARDLLVPLRGRGRRGQPRRPHAHGAARRRPAAGALHVRELPERVRGRAERLPAHDPRGRARAGRRAARLRAAPRRLHLRGGRLPRGEPRRAPLRPAAARRRPLPRRREGPELPHRGDAPRLPHALPRVPPGSRPAGRAGALAVRRDVGQPRVLVARLAVVPVLRRRRAHHPDAPRGGEPGVVRVPAGADPQGRRRFARALRGAGRRGREGRAPRRLWHRAGAQQPARDRQPLAPAHAALRPAPRAVPDRALHAPLAGPDEPPGGGPAHDPGVPRALRRGDAAACSTPAARRRAAAPPQTITFGDATIPNYRKDEAPQTLLGPAQKAWFLERLRASTGHLEGLGQLARHARLASGSAEPAGGDDPALAGPGLRQLRRRRRLVDGLHGARRDLRRGQGRRDHGLRHRLRRSPQLLGRALREGAAARGASSPSGSRSSPAPSRPRASSRPTSTASRRTTRCERSTSPTSAASRSRRSTCCSATACAPVSSTSGPAT